MRATTEKAAPSRRVIGSRWTPKLTERGWTPVSDDFLANYAQLEPEITSTEAMLIIHLIQHKWDEKAPYPAFKTLGKRMGMSPTAVRNHARSLERKGYLRRERREAETNRFHLDGLFKALEEHMEGKPAKPKRVKQEVDLTAFTS